MGLNNSEPSGDKGKGLVTPVVFLYRGRELVIIRQRIFNDQRWNGAAGRKSTAEKNQANNQGGNNVCGKMQGQTSLATKCALHQPYPEKLAIRQQPDQ